MANTRGTLILTAGLVFFSGFSPLHAQVARPPVFEAASVKPHGSSADRTTFMPPSILPGGRFVSKFAVSTVISWAYKLPTNPSVRLSGMPDWTRSINDSYDIEATGVMPDGLSTEARADRMRLMVQALLADRFKLAMHREAKEMPVYEVVVAKGGPKLQAADIQEKDCPEAAAPITLPAPSPATPMPDLCHSFNGGQGRGLHGRAVTIADVAAYVENWAGRPLLDKTGLKGLYRIETSPWRPVDAPAPPPGAKADNGADMADLPTLFEVFDRLGLKLESQKDMADVYVIDHMERPSEN